MNAFRRALITLSAGIAFLLGLGLGRTEPSLVEILIVGAVIVGYTFWSLSGWDAADTATAEAVETLAKMPPELRKQIEAELQDKGRLPAVKLIRAEKGLGLKESMELLKAIERAD